MSSIRILKSIYLFFVLMYQLGYKRINPSLKISLVISKFSLFWWFFVIFTPKFSISLKFCIVREIYVFFGKFFFSRNFRISNLSKISLHFCCINFREKIRNTTKIFAIFFTKRFVRWKPYIHAHLQLKIGFEFRV